VIAAVSGFVSDNWAWIEPVIWGIVGAVAAWKFAQIGYNTVAFVTNFLQALALARSAYVVGATLAQAAATTTATGAQVGLNAAMLANPMTWIVLGIIALVVAIIFLIRHLIKLWNTNDDFAAGLVRAWNKVLGYFDQIPIWFVKVGAGIVGAFLDAKATSLQIMQDLINGTIDKINGLIERLNKIPGVQLDAISHMQITGETAAEAEAFRQASEKVIASMESDAAEKAVAREQKVLDMLESRAEKRAKEEAGKKAEKEEVPDFDKFKIDVGTVDEVGKIKDKVDISSEDLKVMRDLAEMRSIQNFVTNTPTIQVTTGPISKDVDVDELIARIGSVMERETDASASGNYF